MKILNKFGLNEIFDLRQDGQALLQRGLGPVQTALATDRANIGRTYPLLAIFAVQYLNDTANQKKLLPQSLVNTLPHSTVDARQFPKLNTLDGTYLRLTREQLEDLHTQAQAFDTDFASHGAQVTEALGNYYALAAEILRPQSASRNNLASVVRKVKNPSEVDEITKALDIFYQCASDAIEIFV